MRECILTIFLMLALAPSALAQEEMSLETYLSRFDYEERTEMKIESQGLIPLLISGKAVLVDIRFPEEVAAWRTGFALAIPLNELPKRLTELPKDKIIVTACPHKDRAIIAMTFLKTKGFEAKYLADGLVSLAEYVRGDRARDLIETLAPPQKPPEP